MLTISIIITPHYSIKLSTIYITEGFFSFSVVVIEDEYSSLRLAAFETRHCSVEEIS